MSRNLLILALLVLGTGCSATRPLLSTIIVTPPKVSFGPRTRGDAWHWTAVAVTYLSESLIPVPCAPSPVRPVELMTFVEKNDHPAPQSPSDPVPSVTAAVPVPTFSVPALAPPTIALLDGASSPLSAHLPVPSVVPVSLAPSPMVQAAIAVTYPTGSLTPPPCSRSPVRTVELVTFVEEDVCPAPWSPPLTESEWKQSTGVSLVSPVQTGTAIRYDQDETTRPEAHQVLPVEPLSPPVLVQADLTELLTEIRNQRQLIEALQRDLTRERSADDSAIDELEAAVENLLVQAQTAPSVTPTTMRK